MLLMRRLAATSSGVHLLSDDRVIDRLVDAAGVGDGDLVIDFGAGPGTITAPLARTGSRVLAVERDARFVATLRRRFDDRPSVRVVHDDLRTVRLPRRAFAVVASIPFAVSTPLLRRLLTPAVGGFSRAELVVEWGLAKRLTAGRPRDLESAWWARRFALTVRRRIPARCFSPAPRVDAAHLGVRRRSDVDTRAAAILWVLLARRTSGRGTRPAWRCTGWCHGKSRTGYSARSRWRRSTSDSGSSWHASCPPTGAWCRRHCRRSLR